MADAWRLGPRTALLHQRLANAFQIALHPALEDVDHLEFDVVVMQLGDLVAIARSDQADHMRPRQAGRRVGNAEVAVPRIGAQAVGLEILVAVMADRDALLRPPSP